jgi:transposase
VARKHHILTEAHGTRLMALLTVANRHDITQLFPLLDAIPPLRGCPGRPVRKPRLIQGDRGYDSQPLRDALQRRGMHTQLAKPPTPHGSGLGLMRCVAERTFRVVPSFSAPQHWVRTSAVFARGVPHAGPFTNLLELLQTVDLLLKCAFSLNTWNTKTHSHHSTSPVPSAVYVPVRSVTTVT